MTTTNLGMTIPTVGADTDNWGNDLNTDLGLIDAFAGKLMPGPEVSLASAATTDIGNAASTAVAISGTTTITSFGTVANCIRYVRFTGALTLTYNATSLVLLGGGNRETVSGARGIYKSDTSGNWIEISYADQDVSSSASAKLGSLSIGGAVLGINACAINGNALINGTVTASGVGTSQFDAILCHGDAGSSGSLTATGFGNTGTYSPSTITTNSSMTITAGGNGGVILTSGATSWASTSQRRLKDRFEPIVDALGIIDKHKFELGNYKVDAEGAKKRAFVFYEDARRWWPVAANDVPAHTLIDPETGRKRRVKAFKGVAKEEYVPLLGQSIKELIAENRALKSRLAKIERELEL